MLKVIETKSQIARSFRLTIGLIEGYENGKRHTAKEVGQIVASWLKSQRAEGLPYLPGSVTRSTMYYYGRAAQTLITEPVVFYEGDVSPEYNADLPDDKVIAALQDLATILALKLNQTRIYLRYNGIVQILEQVR